MKFRSSERCQAAKRTVHYWRAEARLAEGRWAPLPICLEWQARIARRHRANGRTAWRAAWELPAHHLARSFDGRPRRRRWRGRRLGLGAAAPLSLRSGGRALRAIIAQLMERFGALL